MTETPQSMSVPPREEGQTQTTSAWGLPVLAVIQITLAIMVGRLPGFFVPVAVGRIFGANSETDIFFLVFGLGQFILSVIFTISQHVAIPFLVDLMGRDEDPVPFIRQTSGFIVIVGLGLMLMVGVVFLPYMSANRPEEKSHFVLLLASILPFVALSLLSSAYSGALYAKRSYITPSVAEGIQSLTVLGLILATGVNFGVFGLVFSYVGGALTQMACLGHEVKRIYGRSLRPILQDPRMHSAFRDFLRSGTWQLLGATTLASTIVVDRVMALALPPGSVSILTYAERIWLVPVGLLASGTMMMGLTEWSRSFSKDRNLSRLSRNTAGVSITLALASLPLVLLLIHFREFVASVLFGEGDFPGSAIPVLAATLAAYWAAVPLYLVGLSYTRAILVLRRTDLLFAINVIQLVLKIGFNLLFIRSWGVIGIALSTGGMYAVSTILLLIIFHGSLKKRAR